MTNEQRAEKIIEKYGFDFENIPKEEIIALIEAEYDDFQEGGSEYIRLLCGYLFCIGDQTDALLLEKVKRGINMDVGCMIDWEWIESLKNGGEEPEDVWSKERLVEDFIHYYRDFEAYFYTPFRNGLIADWNDSINILKHYINRAWKRHFF